MDGQTDRQNEWTDEQVV